MSEGQQGTEDAAQERNTFRGGSMPPIRQGELLRTTHYDAFQTVHEVSEVSEVSEDRLMSMIEMNRTPEWDVSLACLGVTIGFSQNLFNVCSAVYNGHPVGGWDAIASAFCILAIGIGLVSFRSWWKGKGELKLALEKLKERPVKTEKLTTNGK